MLTDTAILNDSENEYYICLDTRVKRQKLMRQLKLPHQFHFILPQLLTKNHLKYGFQNQYPLIGLRLYPVRIKTPLELMFEASALRGFLGRRTIKL